MTARWPGQHGGGQGQARARVVLMDAYCASHVGNDVLTESSIRLVRRIFDAPDIVVHAKTPDAFMESIGLPAKRRLFPNPPNARVGKALWAAAEAVFMIAQAANGATARMAAHRLAFGARKAALRDYASCDVAISIGGEMINDSFRKTLPMYMAMFLLARACGARTVIFPQSIGPLRRRWTRAAVRRTLARMDIVAARDEPSRAELLGLGLGGHRALASPDVGVAQPQDPPEDARAHLARLGLAKDEGRAWIGLTTSAWVEEGVARRSYLDDLVTALEEMARDRRIGMVILPANMPVNGEPPTDYDASATLHARLGDVCPSVLAPPEVIPARRFKAIAGELDAFVSTRMHAAILSSMALTPTVTVNTQRKLAGYMATIGQSRFALDVAGLDAATLRTAIETALDDGKAIRASLARARAERIASLDAFAAEVSAILRHDGVPGLRRGAVKAAETGAAELAAGAG